MLLPELVPGCLVPVQLLGEAPAKAAAMGLLLGRHCNTLTGPNSDYIACALHVM